MYVKLAQTGQGKTQMERKASGTATTRRSKLARLFRLIGALLRLGLFLAMLAAWAGVFSTGSMTFVYGTLGATILYLLLWGFTYVCSRRFRQGLEEDRPAHILLAVIPLLIAGISLLLGFAYLPSQQIQTYMEILIGTGILMGLAFSIGESIDKGRPDFTTLDGCAEGCGEGCFDALLIDLHI